MANYLLREMSDVRNTGKRKVYPKMVPHDTLNTEEFVDEMQKHINGISRGMLTGAVMAMADALVCLLSRGYNVTIGDVGTFSTSLEFVDGKSDEMEGDDDRMAYRHVGVKDINFKASPRLLKEMRRKTKFERVMSGVKVLKKKLFTPEQRLDNALKVIDDDGFITLSRYAQINNLSRTSASKELARLTSGQLSPLTTSGRSTHKVWVRRK